jgi:hypothetical protein
VAAIAVVGAAVLILRAVTMARSEPGRADHVTTVAMEARHRDGADPPVEVAGALWVICRNQIPGEVELVSVRTGGDERVDLTVRPGIGPIGRRRLSGCLEDTQIDRVDSDVVRIATVPG